MSMGKTGGYDAYRPNVGEQILEVYMGAFEKGFWKRVDCPEDEKVYKVFTAGQTLAESCPAMTSPEDVGFSLKKEFDKVVARERSDHLETASKRRPFEGSVCLMPQLSDAMTAKEDWAAATTRVARRGVEAAAEGSGNLAVA